MMTNLQEATLFRGARRGAAALAAAVALTVGSTAQADVAGQIPSDALFAIKVNGIQQVSDDFAALATEWGLAQMQPELGDPVQAFRDNEDMPIEGLDFEGEAALYFPKDTDFEADEPPLVILLPVSDFQAFSGSFENVREEDGVMVGNAPDEDEDIFFVQAGDYAAMSPAKSSLTAVAGGVEGMQMGGPTGEMAGNSDVTLYANFSALAPVIGQALSEEGGKEKLLEQVREAFDDGDVPEGLKRYRPVVEAAAGQGYAVVESFLRDAEAATIGVDLVPEAGITAGVIAQFKDGSYLANTLGDLKTADGNLLSGLPAADYLFFGGSTADPEQGLALFNDLAGPILAELNEVGDEGLITDYVDVVRKFITAGEGARFGLFVPQTQPLGQEPLLQQVSIQTGDAQAIKEATMTATELGPKLMQAFAEQAGEAGEMPDMSVEVEEDAKTVAGVSFTRVKTVLPQQGGMEAMMTNALFGPEGQTAFVATVDDSFLSVSGLSDAQIQQVVEAVQNDAAPLAERQGVAMLDEYLPDETSGVLYIGVGEIARTGLGVAQTFLQAPPVDVPQGLPPVAIAVGPDDNALRIGVVVPKDLVSAMIVTTLQVQQGMGGGPGGGL